MKRLIATVVLALAARGTFAPIGAPSLGVIAGVVALSLAPAVARIDAQRPLDVDRIRAEALEHSAVMQNAFFLTDVYGPRLTGTRAYRDAIGWAAGRLREYGANVHVESFDWGIDWSASHISLDLVSPQPASLLAYPMTWTVGTKGRVVAEAFRTATDIERYEESAFDALFREIQGRVRGRFVLLQGIAPLPLAAGPVSRRLTDAELSAMEAPAPAAAPSAAPGLSPRLPFLLIELMQRLKTEGARAVLWRASGGAGLASVFTLSSTYRDPATPAPLPIVFVAPEHYNRIARLLENHVPIRLALELTVHAGTSSVPGLNLIADIPGGVRQHEIVMLGAHLDSWSGGTGATDNAAGCAVVMEVVRILRTLRLEMDRTVRVALWGGEEGAGAGSQAYVRDHFLESNGTPKADFATLSAYFNLDAGTGKIRGIYTGGNEQVRPIFQAWLAPFADMGARTVSPRRPSGRLISDEGAFVRAGLPGFAFIQDPLEYDTRTHHTNMDLYDRLQPEDLKQAAAVMAAFVYAAATHSQLLPRKPPDQP